MKITRLGLFTLLLALFAVNRPASAYDGSGFSRTVGGSIYGSVQLVDTAPIVSPGIGGGAFFDYRFNDRFSATIESFAITQDGSKSSSGEGSIEFLGIPTMTFKVYFLGNSSKFDPYIGAGIGLYMLTEGNVADSSGGFGLGAQIEAGLNFYVTDTLALSAGGTYRSIGILNSLSGVANAGTYMPYTLFGRVGYRF